MLMNQTVDVGGCAQHFRTFTIKSEKHHYISVINPLYTGEFFHLDALYYYLTGFIQASMSKIQGLLTTVLKFSRTKSL